MSSSNTDKKPSVAIVGAGIAGVTLAVLLHKQDVPYDIYERAREVKPLGSAICIGSNVAPLFRQLGIYDEFVSLSKAYTDIHVYNDKRELDYLIRHPVSAEMGGSPGYIIARPILYDLLLRQVPEERMHMGKKVLSFIETESGVIFQTSDNQTYEADILVGADGAHSAIRQRLYEALKSEGRLPASDNVPLQFTCVSLVGTTLPLDPEEFYCLKEEMSPFVNVLGQDSPYTLTVLTTRQNAICWGISQFLDEETSKENDFFRNSEWGPEAAEAMANAVKDFAIPGAALGAAPGATPLTMSDLIDKTPKGLMSKVMLEEKVFDTWYGDRTVLIGDACHKFNPWGGLGAVNAIHDAVCLANWISVLHSTKIGDIETIFREYKQERHPVAKESGDISQMMRLLNGKNSVSKLLRFISKYTPLWVTRMMTAKVAARRPQISYLPLVDDHGTVKAGHQPSLGKTLKIAEAMQGHTKTV